jgi:hypothetical protein
MKSFKQWKDINENCGCGCGSDCECNDGGTSEGMETHLKNLRIIAHYAQKIHEMVENGADLEEWHQNKISVCRAYLSDIGHAFD